MGRIRVALLGASGSIGLQAADVIAQHADKFELVALASGRGGEQHDALALSNPKARSLIGGSAEDLQKLVLDCAPDIALIATTGVVGLSATVAALEDQDDVSTWCQRALRTVDNRTEGAGARGKGTGRCCHRQSGNSESSCGDESQ